MQELDIRDMTISSDKKYLVSCSEVKQGENPHVSIWMMENLYEGKNEAEDILEGNITENKKRRDIPNWLLCTDTVTVTLGDQKWWIVCAGSITGDIYIW